jgi:hypothetical protein
MDPRVVAEGIGPADVAAQFDFSLAVRDLLTRARDAADRVEEALAALDEEETNDGLEAMKSRLITHEIRYSQPMLLDQIEYLYRNHLGADQLPGADAVERFETLETQLAVILADLEPLL